MRKLKEYIRLTKKENRECSAGYWISFAKAINRQLSSSKTHGFALKNDSSKIQDGGSKMAAIKIAGS